MISLSRKEDQWKEEKIHKEELTTKPDLPVEEFKEEYAGEFAPSLSTLAIDLETDTTNVNIDWWNFSIAFIGLVVSAFSVFIMPIYLGILGTALGYLAYMKGERDVTPWTIALGVTGILIGLFILLFT